MHAKSVSMSDNTLGILFAHAYSYEDEEIMGFLIGRNGYDERDVIVYGIRPCLRNDKNKDRVEISAEEMSKTMEYCSNINVGRSQDEKVNVVGWYHSHPHITVLPSHVDVASQFNQQLMSPTFVGLIVSVYECNTNKLADGDQHQCILFQSDPSENNGYRLVPLNIYAGMQNSVLDMQALAELHQICIDEIFANKPQIEGKKPMTLGLYQELLEYSAQIARLTERVTTPIEQIIDINVASCELNSFNSVRLSKVEAVEESVRSWVQNIICIFIQKLESLQNNAEHYQKLALALFEGLAIEWKERGLIFSEDEHEIAKELINHAAFILFMERNADENNGFNKCVSTDSLT